MAKQIVQGQEWDIESVDGNIVTLVDGQQIEVNDQTLAEIQKLTNRVKRSLSK